MQISLKIAMPFDQSSAQQLSNFRIVESAPRSIVANINDEARVQSLLIREGPLIMDCSTRSPYIHI